MLRFAIRDLLWLTLVLALGVAWWVDWRGRADARFTLYLEERSYPPRTHNEPHPLKVRNAIASFTIRDLLWLTLVAPIALGWWLDRARFVQAAAMAEAIGSICHETSDARPLPQHPPRKRPSSKP